MLREETPSPMNTLKSVLSSLSCFPRRSRTIGIMAHSSGYFALFCTTGISPDDVNDILNKAEDGAKDMYNPGWYYKYVPTNGALSSAIPPKNRTKPPVEETLSEFLDKSLEELAATLIAAPKEVDLNRRFFAVLDKRSESDGSLVLCHVLESEGDGGGDVDWLRCWPQNSSLYLRGMSMMSGTWEELKTSWERKKKKNGVDVVD